MSTFRLIGNKAAGAQTLPRSVVRTRAVWSPVSAPAVKLTPAALRKLKKTQLVELGVQLGLPSDKANKQNKQDLVEFIINSVSSSDEEAEEEVAPRFVDASAVRTVDDVPQSLEDALQLPTSLLQNLARNDLGFPTSVTSAMDKEELIMKLWLGKRYSGSSSRQAVAADTPLYMEDAMRLESAMALPDAEDIEVVDNSPINLRAGDDVPATMQEALRVPTSQLVDLAKNRLGYPAADAQKMEKEDLIVALWLGKPYKGANRPVQSYSGPSRASTPSASAPKRQAASAPRKAVTPQSFAIPQTMEAALQLPMSKLTELAHDQLGYPRSFAEGMEKEELIIKLWLAQPSLSSSEYDFDFDINNLEDVERPSTHTADTTTTKRKSGPSFAIPQTMEAALKVPTDELVDLATQHLDFSRREAESMEKEQLIMKLWLAQPSSDCSEYDFDFDINNLEDVERPSTHIHDTPAQQGGKKVARASFSIPQSMEAALEMPTDELVDLAAEHLGYSRSAAEGMEKEDLIMKLWLAQPSTDSSDFDFDFDINNLEDVERPSSSFYEPEASSSSAISCLEDVPQNMEEALQIPTSQLEDLAVEQLGYPRMYIEGMEKEELIMKLWHARE